MSDVETEENLDVENDVGPSHDEALQVLETALKWFEKQTESDSNQLISAIKIAGLFSIQLDETTDVSKDAQLMVYVRYPGLTDIQEDILFCKPMSTTTRGEDIFRMVYSFFKEEGLNWNQCFSICTDGAAAMAASQKGFSTRAKQMNPQIISIHWLSHLASKKLSPEFCIVLDEIVAVVKSRALNCRIFRKLCFEFGAEYEHLLYYSEITLPEGVMNDWIIY
ncbi:zinc finger BED domain-containing protein 5-like [Diorhabda carinulata]|uniref:zinc finger BED domain-containing protein 5-like n=1 Tax=Diorhabda carinulata TaxID=1163345 RepID=UPI0025A0802D|nr:zinc finger BED domain-containing protein 5-like [Diorhabda carinulata]